MSGPTVEDADARAAALDLTSSVLCTAPAGSGKTELLVQRALACLAQVETPEQVVLLTFTNKAAGEIRERLVSAVTSAAGDAPKAAHARVTWELAKAVARQDREMGWRLAMSPGRIRAMTIDALCQRINQQSPMLSGMGGSGGVLDDPSTAYRDAILAMVDDMQSLGEKDPLRVALASLLRLVSNRTGTLVDLLGAMLARRDQWLPRIGEGIDPHLATVLGPVAIARMQHVCDIVPAVTRAAYAEALHATGRAIAGRSWPAPDLAELGTWKALCASLLTGKGGLRKRLTAKEGFAPKKLETQVAKDVLKTLEAIGAEDVASALCDVAALPDLDHIEAAESACAQVSFVLKRAAAYLSLAFIRAGGVDFVEVATRARSALGGSDGTSSVLERMDYRIRHILVDEAQDTSSSQYALLRALTAGWEPGDGRTLFLVGDPMQSIYGFREADVRLFARMRRDHAFGDIPLRCLALTANFRSDAGVVDWVNTVFSRVLPSHDNVEEGEVAYTGSRSVVQDAGVVEVHRWQGTPEVEEPAQVVASVRRAMTERPGGSIAILVRSRAHVTGTLRALRDAGIKFACKDIDPLVANPAVQDAVALIRAMWHDGDRVAWATLLRAPFVGLSLADLHAVTVGATRGSVRASARARIEDSRLSPDGRARLRRFFGAYEQTTADRGLSADLGRLSRALWERLGGGDCVSGADLADVESAFSVLERCLSGGRLSDIADFERGLARLYASTAEGAVQVMTMHGAKGLEFDTVLLVGLWRKPPPVDRPLLASRDMPGGCLMVPKPGYRGDEVHRQTYDLVCRMQDGLARREQARLLYVACTRARHRLELFDAVDAKGKPVTGSASAVLADALSSFGGAAIPASGAPAEVDTACPLQPRVPAEWEPQAQASYLPAIVVHHSPSEAVVGGGQHDVEDTPERLYARLVGTAYHETMQFLLDRHAVARFDALGDRLRIPMEAGMRRRGMPLNRVDEAVQRVYSLVRNTLASPDGQWLAADHPDAHNEYAVNGFVDGVWTHAVIDRVFRDGGKTWVVDYKTGGPESTGVGDNNETFIEREKAEYRPQVDAYKSLVAALVGGEVEGALYFPAIGRLIVV